MHACTPLIFDSGENSDDYTLNQIELHSEMKKLITQSSAIKLHVKPEINKQC
jgi:hypothetical protein